MIDLTGLPLHVQRDIEREINTNPTVIKYRETQRDYQRRGKYVEAMKIGRMLAEVEEKVKQGMLVRYDTLGNLYKDMTEQDIETINVACNSIVLMSDLIETQVLEMNQVIKKYHPDYRVEMYDRFVQIGQEAKEQMRYMSKWTNRLYQAKFGDVADDMMEMIANKVRKLLRMVVNERKGE